MKRIRKHVREFLLNSSRDSFNSLLYQAKLTPRQQNILNRRYLDGYSNCMISMELNISIETVRNDIGKSYDQIARCLFPTFC